MRFTTLFFDLDDTLYPSSTGLWPAIKDRMNLYMIERLCIPEQDVPFLREQYFKMYGTTLRGLQERHDVDKEDFLAFVHDLPLNDYLAPDPLLRDVLTSLPTRNLIFTNAD
ncbi:MAG: pyrimidine 5'-nucleotidase, partial [Chloroflexota bacterium]|nr:pyrimidine 5'-nucleotidase [Chloroflexota bacterium]